MRKLLISIPFNFDGETPTIKFAYFSWLTAYILMLYKPFSVLRWRLNIFMLVLNGTKYENNPSRTADVIKEDGYQKVSNIFAVFVAKSLHIWINRRKMVEDTLVLLSQQYVCRYPGAYFAPWRASAIILMTLADRNIQRKLQRNEMCRCILRKNVWTATPTYLHEQATWPINSSGSFR